MSGVHDSAFLICSYRASDVALSGDPYAHLWITPESSQFAEGFLEVSPYEAPAHCLRNRFFLDEIKSFLKVFPDGVVVNIGAGFSLYPYLLEEGTRCCDVDQREIIDYKAEKLKQFEAEGKLPKRQVTYLSADLNDRGDRFRLEQELAAFIDGAPVFILIEGVIFFLEKETVDSLFFMFGRMQKRGDVIAAVSFIPEIEQLEVYELLKRYLAETADLEGHQFTNLPVSYYRYMPDYRMIVHEDQCEVSRGYRPELPSPVADEILNEHFYVLQKTKSL